MDDLISRKEAIDELRKFKPEIIPYEKARIYVKETVKTMYDRIVELPSVQPEVLACGNGELVAQPEPTDIDAKEAVYNLAEKIGIHQLFALTVELRGEPIQPELTYEQVEEYCKRRCLHVVTADFFESTKPQRLGHWIKHIDPFDGEQYECSECGVLWEFNDGTPEDNEAFYCPKCGVKMKGEQDGH